MFLNLSDEQKKIISDTAHSLIGVRYFYGAEIKANDTFSTIQKTGIDCSEEIEYCFAQAGETVPDGAKNQFAKSLPINESDIQVGDLAFKSKNGIISHVALVVENGYIIEAEGWYGKVIKRTLKEFNTVKPTASQPAGIRRFTI